MSSPVKIRVCRSRYEFNDPVSEREEMCQLLDNFERNMRRMLQRNQLQQPMDRALSHRLDERTKRYIGTIPPRSLPVIIPPKQTPIMDENFMPEPPKMDTLEVTIDPRTKPRALPPRVENWMETLLRKPTRQRVRWRSKLHETEPRCSERPPAERVEQLIDVGAEDFVGWLNTLGAERSSLTTDVVKGLFSIQASDETSRALNIAPKEIRAIPRQVAAEWNLPQLALENRMDHLVERNRKLAAGGMKRTAFGRGLPRELRRGWTLDDGDSDLERPDVPDDLMSLKRLFGDIWHLRSVKYLVNYLAVRPALHKPRFLEEKGLFDGQNMVEPIPFYRKVLSKKALEDSIKK